MGRRTVTSDRIPFDPGPGPRGPAQDRSIPAGSRRRLTAILAAEVVGYANLVAQDREGTHAALRDLRRDPINPLLAEYQARLVALMEDRAIAEFRSVDDAVGCAVAVQKAVAAAQRRVPAERRIVFRAGVDLGDVQADGDDLTGDAVNVAAGLQRICAPGDVMISSAARGQLRLKPDAPVDFAGERALEGLGRPIRTYRVRAGGAAVQGHRWPWLLRWRLAAGSRPAKRDGSRRR
jgi:class 3 adenylate cyclase